jgi:membrane protein implicated in regulation of membrane protease activity
VTLLIAILLALFVLPYPWNVIVVLGAALVDVVETALFIWWSKRRRATVGAEALIGKMAVAVDSLWPEGQVRMDGELWKARCEGGADVGTHVIVRGLKGLTLEVEPE